MHSLTRRSCYCAHSTEEETETQATHLPKHTQLKKKKGRARIQTQVCLTLRPRLSQPLTARPSPGAKKGFPGDRLIQIPLRPPWQVPSPKVSKPWHSVLPNLPAKLPQRRGNRGLSQHQAGKTGFCSLRCQAQSTAPPSPVPLSSTRPPPRGQDSSLGWGHKRGVDTACPPPMTWHKDLGEASVKARYVVQSSGEKDLTHLGEVQGLPEEGDPREGAPGPGDGPANP